MKVAELRLWRSSSVVLDAAAMAVAMSKSCDTSDGEKELLEAAHRIWKRADSSCFLRW